MLQVSGGTESLGDEGAGTAITARVQSRREVDGSGSTRRVEPHLSEMDVLWGYCPGSKWQCFGEH